MKKFRKNLIILIAIFCISTIQAQNITGKWEGVMDGQIIQINISQSGTKVCGFTYDYGIQNPRSYCKAYYVGRYEDGFLLIDGTGFIAKSFDHTLMKIGLLASNENGNLILSGKIVVGAYDYSSMGDAGTRVTLKRVSNKPDYAPGTMSACFTPNSKILKDGDRGTDPNEVIPVPVIPRPSDKNPPAIKPKPQEVNPVKPQVPVKKEIEKAPKILRSETLPLPARIAERKKVEQGRLKVNVKNVLLKLYDNGVVDGDTVTVYYNGKLLVDKQMLTEKAIEIPLTLDEGTSVHEIVLFAENLGGIVPNTALIVVMAGGKRYELRSNADLTKNAVLIFEYDPASQ